MDAVICHYDQLIDEENDPVRDPQILKEYMDGWDGQRFIDSLQLDMNKSVLEIGVGTGRLAVRTAPACRSLCGIDISPKTVQRAIDNLSCCPNVTLICGDFLSFEFRETFDVIYSSLTFMHIKDTASAIRKVSSLLNADGLFVLSIDKNREDFIEMPTRRIRIYPDSPEDIRGCLSVSELSLAEQFETDHAYVVVSRKASSAS